ncbi:MAG: peptidylprolyl isomerase [Marinirhabdus sp.]|nr:peptidylprolyl isomerase [Marinirhabdus sp.]
MRQLSIFVIAILTLVMTMTACDDKYPELGDGVYAEFVTNKGTFVAKLYNEETPLTVANFVELAQGKNEMVDSTYKGKPYFNGLTFHRVMADFMIQGGDPLGSGMGNPGYVFPDEFVDTLKHDRKGILSMANGGPDNNGSQFFITVKPTPWLDGKHTVFGEIVIGQEVVDSISEVETIKPGDKPVEDVVMNEVNIINKGNQKIADFGEMMADIEAEEIARQEAITEYKNEKVKMFNEKEAEATTFDSGLKMLYLEKGNGPKPEIGNRVLVHCTGYFEDGGLFFTTYKDVATAYDVVNPRNPYDPMQPMYSPEARLIPGFREGLLEMQYGDKTLMYIPSHLGYGEAGNPQARIPGNTNLVFEVELIGPAN